MADFSEEEIELLSIVPSMIGTAISMSESSGVVGTLKEAMTNAKSVVSGAHEFPDNKLIAKVAPNLGDPREAMGVAKRRGQDVMQRIKDSGIDSQNAFQQQVVKDCAQVRELLAAKAQPSEATEYKAWVMGIAEKVAMGAKEGSFMGFGGVRVSDGEREIIEQIANALEAEVSLA